MSTKRNKKIYYLNRYDLNNDRMYRNYSGYEQVVKYSKQFSRVKKNKFLYKILKKSFFKNLPKDYLFENLNKEVSVFLKVVFSNRPVFYLYADKDAFLLPLLKRKLKLSWIKIYGTLHWPPEESNEYSFYINNLMNEFNGIIGLSDSINSLNHKNTKIIPHGIDLSYWEKSNSIRAENLYLIIGISNRDHAKQVNIINRIKHIDSEAKFILIANHEKVKYIYKDIVDVDVKQEFVTDADLKRYYEKAKGVILFQNHCLASNVVLEAMAMCVPIIANLVGDIKEYLGDDYPLYIDESNQDEKLREFCLTKALRNEIIHNFEVKRNYYGWENIAKNTIDFIEHN